MTYDSSLSCLVANQQLVRIVGVGEARDRGVYSILLASHCEIWSDSLLVMMPGSVILVHTM
jgi:hypothetical protein